MDQAATPQHLWDEYALVQEKIDKVGEFRFYIKGWATTLLSAVVVAAATAPVPPGAVLLGVPVLALFYYFEQYQAVWQRAYVRRAYELERLLRSSGSQIGLVRVVVTTQAEQRRTFHGRLILQAHHLFYAGLLVFLLTAFGAEAYRSTPSRAAAAATPSAAASPLPPRPATSPAIPASPRAGPPVAASPAVPQP